MKFIAILLLLFSAPAAAQTIEQRVDKIITDANLAKNANARVEAEAKRLKADLAKPQSPVVTPPVVTPPPVVVTPPVVDPPHNYGLMPIIDNTKLLAAQPGFSGPRIKPISSALYETPKQNADGTGQFRFTCEVSHMNYDDPILYPGKKGAAHLHVFFGNTLVDFASTSESIANTGDSTCAGGTSNRSAYWVPAVIDTKDGKPLKPAKILVYYKSDLLPGVTTKPFPAGLRMIAGDMKATEPQAATDWGCSLTDGTELISRNKSIPSECPAGSTIIMTVNFPFCWNGRDLDSPDHMSHMAFSAWNNDRRKVECPATHPVQVPAITQKVSYDVVEANAPARWRLSSDNYGTEKPGGYSTHADWWNGWDPKVEETWVKNCLQAARDCHGFLLGDGTTLY